MHATGTFDVTVTPQQADNPDAQAANISRLSLGKRFQGDLEATSHGEMLAAGDGTKSGGYVAIERVTGALHGRTGSFMPLHSAMMKQGVPERWSVAVVPDSGTDQLVDIDGTMTIVIADGKHHYEFAYTIRDASR
ncbi:hypothetical protein BH23ACI1_BH23ACI1_25820 [soil metagenome]